MRKNQYLCGMKRQLFFLLSLFGVLNATARHYDFSAQRISTADGLPSNVVIRIWQDQEGYMWFDTRNGMCRYDGYVFQTADRESANVPQQSKELLTRDAQWQREGQGRLSRHGKDGSHRSWELIPRQIIGYTRNDHFHVADVDERTEAISTYGSGLYLYDKPTGELTQLTKDNTKELIDDNYLTGLFVDRTGCIWLIEDYIGVKCLRMNRLHYHPLWLQADATIQDANYIRCIAPTAGGRLLVANQMGDVYTYNPAERQFTHTGSHKFRVYSSLYDSRGRQWTGTRGMGLLRDGIQVEGLPSRHVFNIRESRDSIIVSMLEGGVAIIHAEADITHLLEGKNAHDALCHDGRLWVATEEGLYLLGPDGQPADRLQGCFVCLYADRQGRLWAGSMDQGLAKVGMEDGHIAATYYNMGNGLSNNSVCTLIEDRRGRLWLGTEEGLSCLDPATGEIVNYHITESRTTDVFCERTAVSLPDGRLLFGTHDGIIEVEPTDETHETAPLTTLTGLLANGESATADTRLSYRQNNITFLFSNFQYADQQSVRYQYRLDGADRDWNEPTAAHSAVYLHLPPGRYMFRVRSTTGAGQWGPEATFQLHIHQPWWNTWWAWCLYLLTATVAGWVATVTVRRFMRLHRSLEVERRVSAFQQDFYSRLERELRSPINVVQGAAENVQLSGTSRTTVQSLRRGSRRVLKLMDMIRQFHQLDKMEMQLRAEQADMAAEAEQHFREIQQSIRAEEGEHKELAPPPINEQTVVVVGEDDDSLTHLVDTLNPYFHIVALQDTGEALATVSARQPQLVLIDITDNETAARQLTQQLHGEQPSLTVIHLSPFDDDAHQLRSLRSGATDYLVKPCSSKVLVERIGNSITRAAMTQPAETAEPAVALLTDVKDRKFLDHLQVVLEAHVSDPDFSVEQWASLMNLGRTQFYKKVKTLTGETPVQHLHRARLEYAARLLNETTATIEDIMLRAGFHSPTHFYQAFKKHFGQSPRDYRLSHIS